MITLLEYVKYYLTCEYLKVCSCRIFYRLHWFSNEPWWRHQIETFSASLALGVGNSPGTDEFPSQRPVTPSFDISFDLCLSIRLSKQSWGCWFEMPSGSLWRHCNDQRMGVIWCLIPCSLKACPLMECCVVYFVVNSFPSITSAQQQCAENAMLPCLCEVPNWVRYQANHNYIQRSVHSMSAIRTCFCCTGSCYSNWSWLTWKGSLICYK